MATISSVFKMEDKASNTFMKTAKSMDDVIEKADKIASLSSGTIGGNVSPALQQAVQTYQELEAQQDQINNKIELMAQKERILQKELTAENNAYTKNEKRINSIQMQLSNVAEAKERLIKKSDQFTKKIEDQANKVNNLAENMNDVEDNENNVGGGIDKWTAKMLKFNQTIQAAKTIIAGVKKVLDMSDELTLSKARLNMINDGMQTTVGLQNKIYQAAQRSRGSYEDMSKSIAKLGLLAGDAFKSNDELVAFSEMLNKSFKVSGASQQEISSATYQLTQAMAAGKLQGDEFRSIMENAPMLADAIAKYMGKSKGELKELSSEGVITSDIIKNALFSASDDINAKFEEMPKTFGDAMTNIQNTFQRYLQPIADRISQMLNSEKFNNILNKILVGIQWFAGMALKLLTFVGNTFNWLSNHMYVLAPVLAIIGGVMLNSLVPAIATTTAHLWAQAAAWMAANWQIVLIAGVLGIVIGIMMALKAPMEALLFVIALVVVALAAWNVAQWALNGAMYACPIVWIIVLIIAIIAAIVFLIQWIAKAVGSTNSAIGIILGALAVAGAFIWDLFLGMLDLVLGVVNYMVNPWITFANFLANLFNDPIGAIVHLFGDMADTILGLLQSIAKALDKVFGSNMAGTVGKWRKGLDKKVEKVAKEKGNGKYKKVMESLDLSSESLGLKRFEYGDAWKAGLNTGNNIADSIGNFDPMGEINKLLEMPNDMNQWGPSDMGSFIDGNGNVPVDVKKNSDKEVNISDEDLQMLKDIATKDYMIRYKQITPNVNIKFGDVKETADVNEVKNAIQRMMEEELAELYVVEEG